MTLHRTLEAQALTSGVCPASGAPLGAQTALRLSDRLHVCAACEFWFWNDRTPLDYDTTEYEEVQVNPFTANCDPTAFRAHGTYAPFFREVPQTAGGALLDVGCGVGRFLVAARAEGWDTRGIDVSSKAVEIGRRGADLKLSCESLDDLLRSGQRYQAVTAFEVLEHVEEPVEVVKSALAVLNPGAHFFCTVPNRKSPTVLKTSRPDWLPPVHLQYYTEQSVARLLERAGGKNVRTGFVFDRPQPQSLRGKAKQLARMLLTGARPDPLGIWGIAQRGAE